MMTEMEGLSYASFWRRFAAWLIDLAALLFVLFLVLVAMKLLREVGAWAPAAASVPGEPVPIWKGLGFNAKLFVIVAYLLSLGPVYFVLFEASLPQVLHRAFRQDDSRQRRVYRGAMSGRKGAKRGETRRQAAACKGQHLKHGERRRRYAALRSDVLTVQRQGAET
jgi:hypothetical protein